MNIVNRLTWKHMKMNRRRTAVTVVGVIISAAMMTAVFTMVTAWQQMCIDLTTQSSGVWHAAFEQLSPKQAQGIEQASSLKTTALQMERGYGLWNRQTLPLSYEPYVFITAYDEASLQAFPVELAQGRLPQSPGELVIPENMLKSNRMELLIGDSVTIRMGNRRTVSMEEGVHPEDITESGAEVPEVLGAGEYWRGESWEYFEPWNDETYTIVGIAKTIASARGGNTIGAGYDCITYFDSAAWKNAGARSEEGTGSGSQQGSGAQAERQGSAGVSPLPTAISQVNAYCQWERPGRAIFQEIQQIAEENGVSKSHANSDLLEYLGISANDGAQRMILQLAGIMALIVMIGSVALIYNAFAISVSERLRQLGMLSSVGATRRQLRNSVFFEGLCIGAMGIVPGIFAGYLGLSITFAVVNPIFSRLLNISAGLQVVVRPWVIATAVLLTLLTILLSAWKPAMQAGRISAIEAIRQNADVKLYQEELAAKQVRTGSLTRRMLGIEGEISLKNLKRNRRRYRATVFSLSISLALFLSVAYFSDTFSQRYAEAHMKLDYDVMAVVNPDATDSMMAGSAVESGPAANMQERRQMVQQIAASVRSIGTYADMTEMYTVTLIGAGGNAEDDWLDCLFVALGEETLRNYCQEQGLSEAQTDRLFDVQNPSAIVGDPMLYVDYSESFGRFVHQPVFEGEEQITLFGLQTIAEDGTVEYWTGKEIAAEQKEIVPVAGLSIAARAEKLPMGLNNSYSYPLGTVIVSVPVYEAVLSGRNEALAADADENLQQFCAELAERSNCEFRFLTEGDSDLALTEALYTISGIEYVRNLKESFRMNQQMLFLINVFCYGFVTLISLICAANIFNTISTSVALRRREFAMLRSVGLTPQQFARMIRREGALYIVKALVAGLPLSLLMMGGIYRAFSNSFSFGFQIPWAAVLAAVAVIVLLVFATMAFAVRSLKHENIIDGLRQENL